MQGTRPLAPRRASRIRLRDLGRVIGSKVPAFLEPFNVSIERSLRA